MIRFVSILFTLSFFLPADAEGQTYSFRHIRAHSHFTSLQYNLIYEEPNSRVWIGTNNGLFSFDGSQMNEISWPDSLNDSKDIRAIFRATDNRLWIGFSDGSIAIDVGNEIEKWIPEEGNPKVPVIQFAELGEQMWIATYGEGLYVYHSKRLYNISEEDGLSSNDIYSMVVGPEGKIWIGTDAGINIVSFKSGVKEIQKLNREDGLADEIVIDLEVCSEEQIWMGYFDQGLGTVDPITKKVVNQIDLIEGDYLKCVAVVPGKEAWVSADVSGLFKYDLISKKSVHVPLPDKAYSNVVDLHIGQEGNLYVLDKKDGIFVTQIKMLFYDFGHKNIQAISSYRDGSIIFGTDKGAFIHNPTESGAAPKAIFQREINVLSLFVDPYRKLWVGTFGEGLYCFDESRETIRKYSKREGLTEESILNITGDEDNIWLATLGGVTEIVNHVDIHKNAALETRSYEKSDGLGTNYIYCVALDKYRNVWFGTDGKGVSRLKNGKIQSYTSVDTIPLSPVYSAAGDIHGNMWFTTLKNGLLRFDENGLQRVFPNRLDAQTDMRSLTTTATGNLLIVTDQNLVVYNAEKNMITTFPEFGLDTDFDPVLNSIHYDNNADVWIGGHEGIIKYSSGLIIDRAWPSTVIDQVHLFDRSIKLGQNTVFSHKENDLTFDFKGLWFTKPDFVRYRYKMEGLDDTWKNTSEPGISYHHLPKGSFIFKAQSSLSDDYSNASTASFEFKITPPFWERPLFIIACLMLLVILIRRFIKKRELNLEQEAMRKKEKLESQYQTLKSQINPHFLFNSFNTLVSTIEENPEAAVEYVENLSDFYRSILQYREKDTIPLQEEVGLVKNYMYLLKKRFGDSLNLDVNINGSPTLIAPLSLQLLVENAVKHNVISKQKPLTIEVTLNDDDYILVTNNLQRKLNPERSTKYGLESLISRYHLLSNRPVLVEKSTEKFIVKIPAIKTNES